jgi:hypothetical protein
LTVALIAQEALLAHPRPIEVYDKLILYGCGDCIEVNETAADATKPRHAPGINDVENPT